MRRRCRAKSRQFFFAIGKPHRPTDAKLTGEGAGRVPFLGRGEPPIKFSRGGCAATSNMHGDRRRYAAPNQRGRDAFHAPTGRNK
jgi:hypothetical protein